MVHCNQIQFGLVWYLIFKYYALTKIALKKSEPVNGFFQSTFPNDIFIIKNRRKNDLIQITISHEHIHLLQYQHYQLHWDLNLLCLKKRFRNDKHAKYLMSHCEVEARLHEMVIAYKNTYSKISENHHEVMHLLASLPATSQVFINRLLDFYENFELALEAQPQKEIDSIAHDIEIYSHLLGIKPNPDNNLTEEFKMIQTIKHFRSDGLASQFYMAINGYLHTELTARFVYEVLPIMYCNLLNYYGYEQLSNDINQSIIRPNFYDLLYTSTANHTH